MSITLLPVSVLSIAAQDRMTEHYKNKFNKGSQVVKYTIDERIEIARFYDTAKQHGYIPSRLDSFGRLVYARPVKSAVQKMLEEGLATA